MMNFQMFRELYDFFNNDYAILMFSIMGITIAYITFLNIYHEYDMKKDRIAREKRKLENV
jgi:hypothetical protein